MIIRKCAIPSFSYIDFNSYVSATFYVIKSNRINLKYLTGILNSKLTAFWLKHKGKMQGSNYQIDKEPILSIPILNPSEEEQKPLLNPSEEQKPLLNPSEKKQKPFLNSSEEEQKILFNPSEEEQKPLLNPSEEEQKPLIKLVDKILNITKSEDYLQNPSKKRQVQEYEKQIDQLVYKLYSLTPKEIKTIEKKAK